MSRERHFTAFIFRLLLNFFNLATVHCEWEESQMQEQNPLIFVCLLFLNTDYMYSDCWQPFWKPLKTQLSPPVMLESDWVGHHFIRCVMHKVNQAILLDYSEL